MGRHGRFENFRIGPSLSNRIESERSIRIRIESRSFAGPYHEHIISTSSELRSIKNEKISPLMFQYVRILRNLKQQLSVNKKTLYSANNDLAVHSHVNQHLLKWLEHIRLHSIKLCQKKLTKIKCIDRS